MIVTRRALSRRTLLRGAGAAIALPLLDAMVPAFSATAGSTAKRLGFIYLPNGVAMNFSGVNYWTPRAKGKDFELVARQLSESPLTAVRGGLMPPFTSNDPTITPLLRVAAFSLKVGEVSPAIHENKWYHIIRLERRFPASEVGFENVDRKELEAKLKDRLIGNRMSELEGELYEKARVQVNDRSLSAQFNQTRKKQ